MKFVVAACSVALLVLVAGCSTSPNSRRYVFAPGEGWRTVAVRDVATSDYEVRFAPVRMPAYLERPQIVTRLNDAEIKIDQFHRWGIPLDVIIAEVLGASIGREVPKAYVDVKPSRSTSYEGYHVVIDVVRLDGFLGGEVELIAQWRVNQVGETNRMVAQRLSRYETTMKSEKYEEYVEAVRLNIDSLGKEIAGVIGNGSL